MSGVLDAIRRIPEEVLLVLGIPRTLCRKYGISGCGLQLDESGDFAWKETTLTMSLQVRELPLFLRIRGIAFDYLPHMGGYVRLDVLTVEKFISAYDGVSEFLRLYDRNKFRRLGRDAFVDVWCLTTYQARLVTLSDKEFDDLFIADPRGPLSTAELISRQPRHSPVLRPGAEFTVPEEGSWI